MSRADELLSQYESKIGRVGQWIAIRRFSGTTVKTYVDVLTRAYVKYRPAREFVGAVTQGELIAIALVGMLRDGMPGVDDSRLVTTSDRLVTGFYGFADAFTTPPLSGGHVSSGKQSAITNPIRRDPEGVLIALEIHAVG